MEFDLIWKAVVIIVGGTFLLRFAGRKSISQMTLAQTVIMIGIGSLLIQPIAGESVWLTLGVGLVLVLSLIALEFIQIKGDFFESLITGKSKVLIENGQIQQKNLRKVRLTVDQLEMNLRQKNVTRISDVQWATLEPNGQVGFILKEEAQPATKKELQQLNQRLDLLLGQSNVPQQPVPPDEQEDLFAEVKRKSHNNTPPNHLQ
ncbi:DUF421 domain-containing protein [Virgibacillus xinjiangensis]|uniref:DUF421 domain-containing protein n=1 Tax=Virgibacillus xinjiangensis TaxID=393090 RepID=A0ABV7CXG2_9BACI